MYDGGLSGVWQLFVATGMPYMERAFVGIACSLLIKIS